MSKLCPKCGSPTRVIDSRRGDVRYMTGDKHEILRTKTCKSDTCTHTFETVGRILHGVYREKQTGAHMRKPEPTVTTKPKTQAVDDFIADLSEIAREIEDGEQ